MSRITRFGFFAWMIVLLLSLPGLMAAEKTPEEKPLEKKEVTWKDTLADIAKNRNTLKYADVVSLTDPLLKQHADNNDVLQKIYLVRVDFATRAGGSNKQKFEELTALTNLLPQDDWAQRARYAPMLVTAAGVLGEKQLDETYAAELARYKKDPKARGVFLAVLPAGASSYLSLQKYDKAFKALNTLCEHTDWKDVTSTRNTMSTVTSFCYARAKTDLPSKELYATLQNIRTSIPDMGKSSYPMQILEQCYLLEKDMNQPAAMLKSAEELISLYPTTMKWRLYKADALNAQKMAKEWEATLLQLLTDAPLAPEAATALSFLFDDAVQSGNTERALGIAQSMFDIATDERSISAAVQRVAQCLLAKDGHLATANAYVLFQRYGQAGADGESGTTDDLKPITIPRSSWLNDEQRKQLVSAAEKDPSNLSQEVLKERAQLYCLAGNLDKMMQANMKAYLSSTTSSAIMQKTAADISGALKARDGFTFAPKAFIDFQASGPNGKDGKAGTADDLKDPLAVKMPLLDEKSVAAFASAWQTALEADWFAVKPDTQAAALNYASALSMSGKHTEAISLLLSLYDAARDERQLNALAIAVASAIRAQDHHLLRGNAFLAFQRYGTKGEDETPGTADDLKNPLAGFKRALPARYATWLEGKKKDFIKKADFRAAGYAAIYQGDAKDALAQFQQARAGCPFDQNSITAITLDIVSALRCQDGHCFGADTFLAFMKYGPAGEDGKAGTKDDLKDPLR